MNIAFIGLGNMGLPMAKHLCTAGHRLTVFDLQAACLQDMLACGACAASSPAAAAKGVDLAITMLPGPATVEQALCAPDGLLSGLGCGATVVDCSTIDPATARALAAQAKARGVHFADAPVSGGTAGAAAASLTFMVGADIGLLASLEPVLKCMGRKVIHCGDVGMGQAAKLCNNLLLAISMIGVSEAMSLGAALGMDAKVLADIINTSSGRCWSSDTYNPVAGVVDGAPASRGYSGGFGVDLMRKDLALANDAARQVRQALPLGAMALQLYEMWAQQGHSRQDFSSIIGLLATKTAA